MLLPGDVLLVAGTSLVSRWICQVQTQGGFHSAHAPWTHAALYIGGGRVVEASPLGGVRVGSVAVATFRRCCLVRRRLDPPMKIEQRYEIAVNALTDLRRGYGLGAVPRLAFQAWRRRLWEHDWRPNVDGVIICSTIVRNAYSRALYIDLIPGMVGVAWPADLSQTTELADVPVGWVKVVA